MTVFHRRNRSGDSLALCLVACLTAYVLQVGIIEPIHLQANDTSGFVRRIEALRAEKPGALVFYKENPDGLAIKYLVNAKMDFSPRFVSDLEPLKNDPSPVWLLTREANAGELRRAGIDADAANYRDRFDGVPYLAVYRPAHPADPASPASASRE